MSEIKGIKIFCNKQMKRLNEGIKSFQELILKSSLLFKYESSEYRFKFFYLDKEDEKIEVLSEEDFQEVLKYHMMQSSNIMKIQLEVKKLNVDEILNNIKLSESLSSEVIHYIPITSTVNEAAAKEMPKELNSTGIINLNEEMPRDEINRSNLSKTLIIESPPIKEISKEQQDKSCVEIANEFSFVEIRSEENKLTVSSILSDSNNNNNNKIDDNKVLKNEEVQVDSIKITSNASTQKPENMKDQHVSMNDDDQKLNKDEEKQGNNNYQMRPENSSQQVISHQIDSNNINSNLIVNSFDEKQFLQQVEELISKKLNNLEDKFISNIKQTNNSLIKNNMEEKKVSQAEDKEIKHINIKENIVENKVKLEIFRHTCDICSKCPILGSKFYCILCNDLVLCGECELKHNHPVIKFNNELIANKDQLMKFMCLAADKNETHLLHKLISKLEQFSSFDKINSLFKSSKIYVELRSSYNSVLRVKPGSPFVISLYLYNNSSINLPSGIKILALNSRDLVVQPFITNFELESKKFIKVDIQCLSAMRNENYNVKFIVFHNNININSAPVVLDIMVGVDENERLNAFFEGYDNVVILPKEKKKMIFDVMNDQLSNKNPEMIRRILEKCQWRIELALDELMLEINENK